MVLLSLYTDACPATYAELFPTRVRHTALSIGYNIAVALFGGFAPCHPDRIRETALK